MKITLLLFGAEVRRSPSMSSIPYGPKLGAKIAPSYHLEQLQLTPISGRKTMTPQMVEGK